MKIPCVLFFRLEILVNLTILIFKQKTTNTLERIQSTKFAQQIFFAAEFGSTKLKLIVEENFVRSYQIKQLIRALLKEIWMVIRRFAEALTWIHIKKKSISINF